MLSNISYVNTSQVRKGRRRNRNFDSRKVFMCIGIFSFILNNYYNISHFLFRHSHSVILVPKETAGC